MPRIALLCACLASGCFFDANYAPGTVKCGSDGMCPPGQTCAADMVCRLATDAAVADTPAIDAMIDARPYALNCNDPGPLAGTVMGSTANRANAISVSCNGSMMLGFDAVYRLDNVPAGKIVNIVLEASYTGAAAYVIQPCTGATTCVGSVYAQPNSPANITTIAAGPPFVVVDSTLAGTNGEYKLTISVN